VADDTVDIPADTSVGAARAARQAKVDQWTTYMANSGIEAPPAVRNAVLEAIEAPGTGIADDVAARAAGMRGGSQRLADEVIKERIGLVMQHYQRTGVAPDPATMRRILAEAQQTIEGNFRRWGLRWAGRAKDAVSPTYGTAFDDFIAMNKAQREAKAMGDAADAAQKATGATQGGTAGSIRQFIQDHPWPAVAGGALGGMALGGFGDDDTTVTVA
jgi:hypothetical protein